MCHSIDAVFLTQLLKLFVGNSRFFDAAIAVAAVAVAAVAVAAVAVAAVAGGVEIGTGVEIGAGTDIRKM